MENNEPMEILPGDTIRIKHKIKDSKLFMSFETERKNMANYSNNNEMAKLFNIFTLNTHDANGIRDMVTARINAALRKARRSAEDAGELRLALLEDIWTAEVLFHDDGRIEEFKRIRVARLALLKKIEGR